MGGLALKSWAAARRAVKYDAMSAQLVLPRRFSFAILPLHRRETERLRVFGINRNLGCRPTCDTRGQLRSNVNSPTIATHARA
jgi:hypothetical protein